MSRVVKKTFHSGVCVGLCVADLFSKGEGEKDGIDMMEREGWTMTDVKPCVNPRSIHTLPVDSFVV